MAGISTRTLHYYDEMGLLKPGSVGENGYRYYSKNEMYQLQQILFFRELSLSLDEIKKILENPNFDMVSTLEIHRETLLSKALRLQELIQTIDNTINSLKGQKMEPERLFTGFSEDKQAQYQKYAEEHWDRSLVQQSNQRWNSLSKDGRQALLDEGGRITGEIVKAVPLGAASSEVQILVGDWHAYINRFYDCSLEILLALGNTYAQHPDFIAFYRKIDPAMPEFLTEAIKNYCAARGVTSE